MGTAGELNQFDYVITPWKRFGELLKVKHGLYRQDDFGARSEAVKLVQAWSLRGGLPHAVDSTANLIAAQLHQTTPSASIFSIQATYSTAFCRFITGYCDITLQGKMRRPMVQVAQELKMPASWVELRHEVTHGKLPAIVRLESATQDALIWLWDNYWASLKNPNAFEGRKRSVGGDDPSLDPVAILAAFLKDRISEIKSKAAVPLSDSAAATACVALTQSCQGELNALERLAMMMVKPKVLIPADRGRDDNMAGAFMIWTPLLQLFARHEPAFVPIVLQRMIAILSEPAQLHPPPDAFREAVFEWVLQLVREVNQHNGQAQMRTTIMNECTMSVSTTWTRRLEKQMLVDSKSQDFVERWQRYVDVQDEV